MKPPLILIALSFLFAACRPKVEEIISETQLVGGDSEINGCKGSAGYVWSVVLQTCIRVFEEGIAFHNYDLSMNAYVVFSKNKSEAEVFLPRVKNTDECILTRGLDLVLLVNKKGNLSIVATEKEYVLNYNAEKYTVSRNEQLDKLMTSFR